MSNDVEAEWEDVPLYQGSDAARIHELGNAFATAIENVGPRRVTEAVTVREAAKAMDDAKAEALPRAVVARVSAIKRKSFRRILAAHPPREGNERDAELGYDGDVFPDALMEHFDGATGERTLTAPEFSTGNDLVEWLDKRSDGHFRLLFLAALRVNTNGSPDPKDLVTSRLDQMSDVTSDSPRRLA